MKNENIRLSEVHKKLNISLGRAIEYLKDNGIDVDASPNTKITVKAHEILLRGFQSDRNKKVASKKVRKEKQKEKQRIIQQKQVIKAKTKKNTIRQR